MGYVICIIYYGKKVSVIVEIGSYVIVCVQLRKLIKEIFKEVFNIYGDL